MLTIDWGHAKMITVCNCAGEKAHPDYPHIIVTTRGEGKEYYLCKTCTHLPERPVEGCACPAYCHGEPEATIFEQTVELPVPTEEWVVSCIEARCSYRHRKYAKGRVTAETKATAHAIRMNHAVSITGGGQAFVIRPSVPTTPTF